MQLSEVKEQLDISQLEFVRSKDADGKPTPWLRHWDNTRRFAVVAHQDVIVKLKANPATPCALKSEYGVLPKNADGTPKEGAKPYDNHILIVPTTIEEVL